MILAENQVTLQVISDDEPILEALSDRVSEAEETIEGNRISTASDIGSLRDQLNTKVSTSTLQNYLNWSTSGGLDIKDGISDNKVNITSNGISLYAGANAAATISQDGMSIPRGSITILGMGPYILEYMVADGSLTLKEA